MKIDTYYRKFGKTKCVQKKEVVIIVIDINVKEQTIMVYLANGEAAPDIKPMKTAYPQFMIALMRSGCGNCKELTAALLTINK